MRKRIAAVLLSLSVMLTISGVSNYRLMRDKQQELILRIKSRSTDQPEYIFWVGRHDYGMILDREYYYKRPHNRSIRYFQAGVEL